MTKLDFKKRVASENLVNKFGAAILLVASISWIFSDGFVRFLTEIIFYEFGDGEISFMNRLTTAFSGAFVYF